MLGFGGTLLVRVDAGSGIGVGHAMRCLALAQAWTSYYGKAVFACASLPESIERRLQREGCEVRPIAAGDDAGQTIRIAGQVDARWIVLDGYQFGRAFQHELRSTGRPLLVFDDFGQIDGHDADLLLDQNLGAGSRYYSEVPPKTRLLVGSRYAQVRREFTTPISPDREITPRVKNLLVTLGGADPKNVTMAVVSSLKDGGFKGNVTVVVGSANPHGRVLAEQCATAGFRVAVDPSDLPDLMREADLTISAAGSTTWELSALGVPAILLVIADNQREVASALVRRGATIGVIEDPSLIARRLPPVLESALDAENRARVVRNARALVDGRGSMRVATRMAARALRIRRAREEDCGIYLRWANDPVVRANAFDPNPIPEEGHRHWFGRRLNSADCRMFLAENPEGKPVGQIRFDLEDEGRLAVVDVHVAPEARGAGFGRGMIVAGVDALLEISSVSTVEARVKRGNASSQNAFLAADFDLCGEMEVHGETVMRFCYERA